MKGEWHILYRIEEVSNLINFLREYETNTITRNAMRCNNRDDLLHLGNSNLFRGVFTQTNIYGAALFFAKIVSGF